MQAKRFEGTIAISMARILSFLLRLSGLSLLTACGAAVLDNSAPVPQPPSIPTTPLVLRVAANGGMPVKLRQGFLHGLSAGQTTPRTDQLVDGLRPGAWRVSNLFGTHDYVEARQLRSRFGTHVAFNLQDLFSAQWGNPVVVGPNCVSNTPQNCFTDYADLRREWANFIEQFMLAVEARGGAGIDQYDLFSEPGSTLKGVTLAQIFDLLKVAHDTIRRHRPDAVIVAPSIERFDAQGLDAMLAFAAANNVRIDALSWHELEGNPGDVPAHIVAARQLIGDRFALRSDLAPRQIHINEYGPPQNHLIPGWTVGWLGAFEAGGVDVANRACWPITGRWTDCANGINGLLLEDNVTPQPLYHLHKAWAELPPMRLAVAGQVPGLAAIAARDADGITLLVGRYSCGGQGKWCVGAPGPVQDSPAPPVSVRLEFAGLGAAKTASVAVECYANLALAGPQPAPDLQPFRTVTVVGGIAIIDLSPFPDGAACRVRIS